MPVSRRVQRYAVVRTDIFVFSTSEKKSILKVYFQNSFSFYFRNTRACVLWDTALFVVVLVVGDVSTGS